MAGAPTPTLDDRQERELETLVDVTGVPIETAAAALGFRRRTADRVLARRRAKSELQTLDELLAGLPTAAAIMAEPPRRVVRRSAKNRRRGWRESAGFF